MANEARTALRGSPRRQAGERSAPCLGLGRPAGRVVPSRRGPSPAWALVLPLAALLSGCPVTQPQDTPVAQQVRTEPATRTTYSLYVPSTYEDRPNRRWPLVITLHGSALWDGHRRQVQEWKALAEQRGFLVAAPDLRSAEGILPNPNYKQDLRRDERAILAVRAELIRRYNVNPGRVLLTGFSAGGYPLWWTGLRNPEAFQMLISRAANCDVETLERIELGEGARELPILIYWGKDDPAMRKQGYAAFRWLRLHECYGTRKDEVEGGHWRRPEIAYRAWRPHW